MNRRKFLTHILLVSAMAGLAVPTLAKARFPSPRIKDGSGPRKIIFISDIHLSANASTAWIYEHIGPLANFLQTLNTRLDVSELVILGDLLDDWNVPSDYPPSTFEEILDAAHNEPVVTALQEICANPNTHVTYVTGNHDLLSFEPAAKMLIETTFPGMEICSDDPGLGVYTLDEVLWAEHGHRYTLFNAPDIWSHSGSHLPLGYFITRLVASKSEAEGSLYTSPDIIKQFAQSQLKSLIPSNANQDLLIAAIFNAIALWAGKWPWDSFIMEGKDDFTPDPTVLNATQWYAPIMSAWPDRQNIVIPDMALLNEVGYMINSAQLLFTMPKKIKKYYPFKPRIVLFGHTHKARFWQRIGLPSTIYTNTGTWIDSKPMTWVEVDVQDRKHSRRSYTVSLWYEGQGKPSQSGTILVATSMGKG
ncbi:MAG: metallophosphoesterase [Chromatiaceae bacterium]